MAGLTIEQALQTAIAQQQAGQIAAAEAIYRQILTVQPNHADALHLLGTAALVSARYDQALDLIGRAIAVAVPNAMYESNLGETYRRLGRFDEAIVHLRRAVALQPDFADAWNNLGSSLALKGECDEAIACCQRALALKPNFAEAYGNLGVAYLGKGWRDEAIACNKRALALRPDSAELLNNLAAAFVESGDYGKALEFCERALAVSPDFAPAHWARSHMLLRLCRFEEGWREYEWRWRCPPLSAYRRRFAVPQWDGTSLPGQTLLAHAEQGYGDAIQLLRYVPLLRQRAGGGRIILECGRPLVRLIASAVGPDIAVFPRETWDGNELPRFDRHIPWLSLPLTLGSFEPVRMAERYLHANPELGATWRQRLGASGPLRVGLAWTGNPNYQWDHYRSIAPEKFLPLLRLPGIHFYSLQVQTRNGTPKPLLDAGLIDLTAQITDFADTAALVAELDLIISTDGVTVHLGGALGRPVWALLPFVPDWRWGLEREDSPWYPSVRLFRQSAIGDWNSVLRRVEQACAKAATAIPERRH